MILAIDPGPAKSAWLVMTPRFRVVEFAIEENEAVKNTLRRCFDAYEGTEVAIEMIASYGMPVGASIFSTCVWIGRFIEAWRGMHEPTMITRNQVKNHICHSSRAKDSNIRQALIDRYPALGGGKTPQVGTVKSPGPLFGIKADIWAALAVAITFIETRDT